MYKEERPGFEDMDYGLIFTIPMLLGTLGCMIYAAYTMITAEPKPERPAVRAVENPSKLLNHEALDDKLTFEIPNEKIKIRKFLEGQYDDLDDGLTERMLPLRVR